MRSRRSPTIELGGSRRGPNIQAVADMLQWLRTSDEAREIDGRVLRYARAMRIAAYVNVGGAGAFCGLFECALRAS